VPTFLTPGAEESHCSPTDRPVRSAATMRICAVVGSSGFLRAEKSSQLELGDPAWRSGEKLVIHGNGRCQHVPLIIRLRGCARRLPSQTIAVPAHPERVFLRTVVASRWPSGSAAIDHIVRLAFVRAGFPPPRRPAGPPHICSPLSGDDDDSRRGASMSEITPRFCVIAPGAVPQYMRRSAFEELRGCGAVLASDGGA